MNHIFPCLLSLYAGLAVPAALAASPMVEPYHFPLNTGIPDANSSGLAGLQTLVSAITEIQDVTVTLDIAGSWNGDLYATLQHASGFAVLLNRVGRSGSNPAGFGDAGMTVSINDLGGFSDIHGQSSGGGLLAGTFGSDGRTTDPGLVLDTDPRVAMLDSFASLDANGDWTLFVADLSGGDTHTLNSWGLEITGVPEPGTISLLALSAMLFVRRKRSSTLPPR